MELFFKKLTIFIAFVTQVICIEIALKKNKDQSCTLPSDDLLNLALMISTCDSAEPKSIDSQDHPSLALLTW
jgi:hypothetical protein